MTPMTFSVFRPSPTLSEQDIQRSLRLMVVEGMASGGMFSLVSGGFMAAYALALGANNLQVGLLAALPFISQVGQLPAILLVERLRARKALVFPAMLAAQLCWLPIGLTPFLIDTPGALAVAMVIAIMALRGLFAPVWVTSWSSWLRDLVPRQRLAGYHGRRLAALTTVVVALGLGGSYFVRWWEGIAAPGEAIYAYSFLIVGGALTLGLIGPACLVMAKEPLMPPAQETDRSAADLLLEPVRDRNFSKLLRFLFVWGFTSNLAIPFFAVYMLTTIGLPLTTVIAFTVLSQVSNVLFVRVWGALADRAGSKTVLSLSASLYLLVILGWIFTTHPDRYFLTLPLLAVLHIFAGIAAAGVTLTVSTIAVRVAPQGRATAFVGIAAIATSLGAGAGPIAGGTFADFFSTRSLSIDISWVSPEGLFQLPAVSLAGFDFLFAIAFVLGLLSLNLLISLEEEGEAPRADVLTELMAGAGPVARAVSSVPGLNVVSSFSYGHLKRVPGADVALGVTAYQLAASTQTAVASVERSRAFATEVSQRVGSVLSEVAEGMEDVANQGLELARHATRGAVQAGDDATAEAGRLARGAVLGALEALRGSLAEPIDVFRGAGYGVVQGAVEAGSDPAETAAAAMEAAREAAADMGVSADQAAQAVAEGLLEAAANSGGEALRRVREVVGAHAPDTLLEGQNNTESG